MQPAPAHVDGPSLASHSDLLWVGDIPSVGAARYPDRDALIFADRALHLTYAQLDQLSNRFAALLQTLGLVRGDRIAYLGKNSEFFYVVLFGAIRAGAVLVPINWRLAAPEIRFQLSDSAPRILIYDTELWALASQAVLDIETPLRLLPTDGATGLRDTLTSTAEPVLVAPSTEQIILQLYTSGTTGQPKGVLISHAALSMARHAELASPAFAHMGSGCVALSAMPNFHIGGMSWVLIGLVRFGTVVITADPAAANMVKLIRHYGTRYTWMVPTLIRALVDNLRGDPANVPQLSGIFYGAMPMDIPLLRESMELFGCSFLQFFGMTEVGGAAAALAPDDHDLNRPALLKSVGKPYPGMSIEIRGAEGRLLTCGQHGEIWIKSPTVMQGYWKLPERTAEAVVDGWYASGDGGYLDAEGYLYLTDRIKDMIVTGGENVYPVEVEQTLRLHPAIIEAAVVGMPDPRWGERVVAVIETGADTRPSVEELIAFCRQHIADFKCPKHIEITHALPRTASGKVQRGVVRQALLTKASAIA